MSLINQMLRDLEARRAPPVAVAAAGAAVSPVSPLPRQPGRAGIRLLLGALLALLAVVAGQLLRPSSPDPAPLALPRPAVQVPVAKAVAVAPVVVAESTTAASEPSAAKPTIGENTTGAEPAAAPPAVTAPGAETPSATEVAPVARLSAASQPSPAPRVEALRIRRLDGRTRVLLDLEHAVDYRSRLEGDRLVVSLGRVDPRLPRLPALDGTPFTAIDSEAEGDRLRLSLHLGAVQRLRGSVLQRRAGGGARLVVSLQAEGAPPVVEAPGSVHKQARPLDARQRAAQATQRARGLLERGRQTEAELAFAEALRLDADALSAREALAALYLNAGRLAEAESLLRQGLVKNPRAAALARLQARLLADRGELGPAIAVLELARPGLRDDPDYHALLAALYQRAGDNAHAAQTYGELLRLRPAQASWWLGLGLALEAEGDAAGAAQAFVRAHQLGAGLEPAVLDWLSRRIATLAAAAATQED